MFFFKIWICKICAYSVIFIFFLYLIFIFLFICFGGGHFMQNDQGECLTDFIPTHLYKTHLLIALNYIFIPKSITDLETFLGISVT